MQKAIENVAKAAYLRSLAQGHLYGAMIALHKASPDQEAVKACIENALATLAAMQRTHRAIERKTNTLLSALWEYEGAQ
jgi:hypothetical protein